jgi:hypothetical protein
MVMKIKPFYRPVGTITLLWNILTSNKRNKMTDFIPYFGIITVLFGVAFAYALTNTGKKDELQKKN